MAYILNRDLELEAIDGVIAKLQKRKKSIVSRQDWLRTYLSQISPHVPLVATLSQRRLTPTMQPLIASPSP